LTSYSAADGETHRLSLFDPLMVGYGARESEADMNFLDRA
jgi:hypothetical protein